MVQPAIFRDVVDRLVMLGLGEEVAETYVHLLMQGAIRPGALALIMRVSRAEAYRRLQALAELELATATQERPVSYHPADPGDLFDVLERSVAMQANVLKEVRAELQPFLADLSGSAAGTSGQTFRYLVGRGAYYEEIRTMLEEAEEEVLVVNTHPAGPELADRAGLWALLALRAEAGVPHRVLLQDTPAARRRRQPAIRLLPPGTTMRFVIVDRTSMLVCTVNDASTAQDAPLEEYLVTSAPGFLAAHLALFERLWSQAMEAQPVLPAAGRALE